MKGILRKKWFWVVLVLLVIGAAVVWLRWPKHYDLTVSYETTRLLGPLNEDGTVNYVAALNEMYGQGVTPENNAAVLLIQAFGPEELLQATRERVLELLGMDPLPETGDYFVSLYEYADSKAPPDDGGQLFDTLDNNRDKAMAASWSTSDYPQLADWLKSIAGPLDIVTAASKRPRYYVPLVSPSQPPRVFDVGIPHLTVYREAARSLLARAMLRAGEGKCGQAISDLLVIHRLARLICQGHTLIEGLIGLSMEAMACGGVTALAGSGKLSAEQAKALLGELNALGPMPGFIEAIDRRERYGWLDAVAVMARWQWSGRKGEFSLLGGVEQDEALAKTNVDWNELCRELNRWCDRVVATMRTEPYSARTNAIGQYSDELAKLNAKLRPQSRSRWLEDLFGERKQSIRSVDDVVAAFMVDLARTQVHHDRTATRFRLAKVAVALAAFMAKTGAYPEELDELVGEYFKKLPEDLFAEGPLKYRRTKKGYLLYSIGENGVDDKGVEDYRTGDIVISVGQQKRVPPDPYAPSSTSRPGDGRRPGPGR